VEEKKRLYWSLWLAVDTKMPGYWNKTHYPSVWLLRQQGHILFHQQMDYSHLELQSSQIFRHGSRTTLWEYSSCEGGIITDPLVEDIDSFTYNRGTSASGQKICTLLRKSVYVLMYHESWDATTYLLSASFLAFSIDCITSSNDFCTSKVTAASVEGISYH
jgi:hypothetical protein